MEKVILASASPRRQELLKMIFDEFDIIPADIDESVDGNISAEECPEIIARKKAEHISRDYPDSLVIGCDTAVIADGKMLGKPVDSGDAVRMLKLLSGKDHKVVTGCCLCKNGKEKSFSVTTLVRFYELSETEIEDYIRTGEWTDKAGAYGIQGAAGLFVEKIDGDYNNVVGLPCARLSREIGNI